MIISNSSGLNKNSFGSSLLQSTSTAPRKPGSFFGNLLTPSTTGNSHFSGASGIGGVKHTSFFNSPSTSMGQKQSGLAFPIAKEQKSFFNNTPLASNVNAGGKALTGFLNLSQLRNEENKQSTLPFNANASAIGAFGDSLKQTNYKPQIYPNAGNMTGNLGIGSNAYQSSTNNTNYGGGEKKVHFGTAASNSQPSFNFSNANYLGQNQLQTQGGSFSHSTSSFSNLNGQAQFGIGNGGSLIKPQSELNSFGVVNHGVTQPTFQAPEMQSQGQFFSNNPQIGQSSPNTQTNGNQSFVPQFQPQRQSIPSSTYFGSNIQTPISQQYSAQISPRSQQIVPIHNLNLMQTMPSPYFASPHVPVVLPSTPTYFADKSSFAEIVECIEKACIVTERLQERASKLQTNYSKIASFKSDFSLSSSFPASRYRRAVLYPHAPESTIKRPFRRNPIISKRNSTRGIQMKRFKDLDILPQLNKIERVGVDSDSYELTNSIISREENSGDGAYYQDESQSCSSEYLETENKKFQRFEGSPTISLESGHRKPCNKPPAHNFLEKSQTPKNLTPEKLDNEAEESEEDISNVLYSEPDFADIIQSEEHIVDHFLVYNSYGSIQFLSPINLSQIESLSDLVFISKRRIELLPQLSRKESSFLLRGDLKSAAILTFNDVPISEKFCYKLANFVGGEFIGIDQNSGVRIFVDDLED